MNRLLTLVATLTLTCSAWAANDLKGTITTADGQPLAGATVYISTAAVKVGTSSYCPSCYADCGKSATTGSDGTYQIPDLDPTLTFNLLVARDGFVPQKLSKIDPSKDRATAKLQTVPDGLPDNQVLRGRVMNTKGQPVAGAIISPFGCKDESGRWWGYTDNVADPMAVSNARGGFILVCKKPDIALDLQVEARALSKRNFALVPTGSKVHELTIGEGATVSGQIVDQNGKPIGSVLVGLVQGDRGCENFVGAQQIGTDSEGQFNFVNVGPPGEYFVYGIMSSLGDRGAPMLKALQVGGDETTVAAGQITLVPARTISGKLVLADGQPIPSGTRVTLSREAAWDSLIVICDANGRFTFSGVPDGELVTLSSRVKGYHMSPRNKSFEPLNSLFLMGLVDADIPDLVVQLDAGPGERIEQSKIPENSWQTLKSTRLTGVAAGN